MPIKSPVTGKFIMTRDEQVEEYYNVYVAVVLSLFAGWLMATVANTYL